MRAEDTAFRTIVDVPKWTNPMRRDHRFVLLGSCFAQNIGEYFQSYGLNTVCNPLGVTYNPASISIQVHNALENEELKGENESGRDRHGIGFHLNRKRKIRKGKENKGKGEKKKEKGANFSFKA